MSKWKSKDWWLGQSDDQKNRRAEAREDFKKIGEDLRQNNQNFKEGVSRIRDEKDERDDERKADYQEGKERRAADWEAKKDELRADREDRNLGGWGRKKKD